MRTLKSSWWKMACALAALGAATAIPAPAQQPPGTPVFAVLHTFTESPDGAAPGGGLVNDAAGNLYGTTVEGGLLDQGTVYEIDKTGAERVLYRFRGGDDGYSPVGSLTFDPAGNLYGATVGGGSKSPEVCDGYGCGTIFELAKTGKQTVLHAFETGSGDDGSEPEAGLVGDGAGYFYGTTILGGTFFGAVFRIDAAGREIILHSFNGTTDGAYPSAALILDAAGSLYGTTTGSLGVASVTPATERDSSADYGTVFKLTATGQEIVLHTFTGTPDGEFPTARLLRDQAGNLYGTTVEGGTGSCGTVFKVTATGHETVLYNFTCTPDGAYPYAGLVRDPAGNLYGTTSEGGAYDQGAVFELSPNGTERVLYSFTGGEDGGRPTADLLLDAAGNLYGTTSFGGDLSLCPAFGESGCGVVFRLTLR